MNDRDPHAPDVHRLFEAGNWAGLARYWLAHQYEPAMERAIDLVHGFAAQGNHPWTTLADFLDKGWVKPDGLILMKKKEASRRFFITPQPPEVRPEELGLEGWGTILLLTQAPIVALCEMAHTLPLEQQESALSMCIEILEGGLKIATDLHDPSLVAFLKGCLARGYSQRNDLEAARTNMEDALNAYSELATTQPEVYRPHVARLYQNLAILHRSLNDLEEARDNIEKALMQFSERGSSA
jgi:predicted RNase H-like HicB family nuclease